MAQHYLTFKFFLCETWTWYADKVCNSSRWRRRETLNEHIHTFRLCDRGRKETLRDELQSHVHTECMAKSRLNCLRRNVSMCNIVLREIGISPSSLKFQVNSAFLHWRTRLKFLLFPFMHKLCVWGLCAESFSEWKSRKFFLFISVHIRYQSWSIHRACTMSAHRETMCDVWLPLFLPIHTCSIRVTFTLI